MKSIQKIALSAALISVLVSCQPTDNSKQILSKPETKKEIMETIANDGDMSKDMILSMMNSTNGKMALQENKGVSMLMMENHDMMMNMMKDKPEMMKSVMKDMMETCKSDTAMMATMCKTMMDDKDMMGMMGKMKGMKMDKMEMDEKKMKGMNHK